MGVHDLAYQAAALGLIIEGPPEIGRLKRCKVEGDRGRKKSGWYIVNELRLSRGVVVLVGAFGNWKTGLSGRLKADIPPLSEQERAEYHAAMEAQRAEAEAKRRAIAEEAAAKAARIWPCLPEVGASDYLDRKRVRAFGLRFTRGTIVVPVRNVVGDLVGLQFIAGDGEKRFLTGTAKQGAFHLIGEWREGEPLGVAEGYATAATVHQATGWAVAVAFDAGNLEPVVRALRSRWPSARIVVCADDDDAGRKAAGQCVAAAGAVIALPRFSEAA